MPRLSKIGAAALAAFGWTGISSVTASYLQVAGGGAGGSGNSGYAGTGGGAGGYLTGSITLNTSASYTISVGAGGAGTSVSGLNGSNSTITGSGISVTNSVGGGGGGGAIGGSTPGASGGSGGGGMALSGAGGAGTASQGNAGGSGSSSTNSGSAGGGGGGAGATGASGGSGTTGGNGGVGLASSITGTSTYYAGGGGGAGISNGTGGNGGGANGNWNTYGLPATASTGGGGGGGGNGYLGGNGGSGVVIISYLGAQQFGGGVVTSSGGYTIHTFNTSGTLSPLSSLSASYLIVAGGGGAGGYYSAGAGAGGMLTGSGVTIDTNSTYLVTVGAGGTGTGYATVGGQGTSSTFSMVTTTAVGGGTGAQSGVSSGSALNGGSGGGAIYNATTTYGTGTSGQGNNGGQVTTFSGTAIGAGGGGAGAVGGNASNTTCGAGGNGLTSSISGTSTYYAGGGGGGCEGAGTFGAGGLGGGGAGRGSTGYYANGVSGTANTGGGGGGCGYGTTGTYTGGNGGSGVVIISYAGSVQQMAGGTVTISGGNVIHTFTSSGYLTPLKLVNNSLRFRSSATAYLNNTFKTPTSATTWTISTWVKRGTLGTEQVLFGVFNSGTDYFYFGFNGSSDQLQIFDRPSGGGTNWLTTTQVFRDPAAWYHIVYVFDTTQATSTNRQKLYINGVQVTAFATQTPGAQNSVARWNASGNVGFIGRSGNSGGQAYIDMYESEVNFIDGQALTPNSFGTFNSYGVWQPITYGGSYGTNGFYLPFISNSSTYAGGFSGSSQYLVTSTNASLALGTNSFTVEYWLYITASAGGTTAVSMGNGTTTYDSLFGYQSGAGIILYLSSNGSAWDIASGISMGTTPVGTWNHVAVTRSGNTFYTFLNGVQVSTFSSSASIYQSANSVAIARAQSGSSVNGNISNVRVVIGTALYTSNFAIPTSNLTAVTNTKLLTLQNATIVDNSTNALTFTNTGTVTTGLTYPFSAAKIFNDQSPQGNNWTPNNISGVSGSTLDYMTDVPTLTSTTAANYCVLNPLNNPTGYVTYSQGNLTAINTASTTHSDFMGTMAMSPNTGKYYWEVIGTGDANTRNGTGIGTAASMSSASNAWGFVAGQAGFYIGGGGLIYFENQGTTNVFTVSWTTGNIIMYAYDSATGNFWAGQNGVWYSSTGATTGNPATGANPTVTLSNASTWFPGGTVYNQGTGSYLYHNFGQQPWAYSLPSGFVALNTYNL